MKKFIAKIIIFCVIGYLIGECIVRINKLTSDIPQRYVATNGIQLYIPGQKGYYKGATEQWEVNKYGWLGVSNIDDKAKRISIIGDSYIENIMNPMDCNQGYLLQEANANIGFFEAGRSGVTFIEALEIAKNLDSLNFDKHLLYLTDADFYESFSKTNRYTDRLQIDLENETILEGELKSPGLKKILYNSKFLYYLYQRFPLFVSKQNKGEVSSESSAFDIDSFNKLHDYINKNYNLQNMVFVFHPKTSTDIIEFFNSKDLKYIDLKVKQGKSWDLNEADGHWSCYGHIEASKQIQTYIKTLNLNENN
ncbi:hypothetical protein [uncultured Psychroserpens sp.]|uniref:hypothetical protein n=1 Tax=uncultured Psychroserpens sp. TaxID=255436 RepID=UPI00262F8ED9|nr:hypothetical protein [uncultured Psychroserpens sp.]